MENLDLTTIINRVRALSNATPVLLKGHDDEGREIDASMLAATVVGAALGCHCPIPPRFVPMASTYFATTYGEEVRATLSKINEAVNIRTQVAYDAAVSIWTDRYEMVHKPCNLEALLLRMAIAPDSTFSNANFVRPLMCGLNDDQKESLDKIVRSVHLSCSLADTKNTIFH